LAGQVAIVTGGSRGLGLRIAQELARSGCTLAICARTGAEVHAAALELAALGHGVLARAVDVSDPGQAAAFVAEVEARYGRVDLLVNNAGIIQAGPLEEMTLDDFHHCVDIDFWGGVYMTYAALPGMKARGCGTIANITSIGGDVAIPHLLPYSCAKAAATAFSEGLTAELGGTGVRVVTVAPWLMRTGSLPYVYFKGRHEAEARLFGLALAPVLSLDADRAARRIVNGIARGEARVTVGVLAKLARAAHALAPGLFARTMGQAGRLMPRGVDGHTAAIRGGTLEI
jgi:NAD(P)-dependent dehydrogenase (short-subunit alcohol dehydrogenase family)